MSAIYLAAAYTARDLLRDHYVPKIEKAGHQCTATWLVDTHEINTGTVGAATDHTDEYLEQHVAQDIEDVRRSDALVLFTEFYMRGMMVKPPYGTGGRHVETGIALALGKQIFVLGKPENVFHRTARTLVVPTFADVLTILEDSEVPDPV